MQAECSGSCFHKCIPVQTVSCCSPQLSSEHQQTSWEPCKDLLILWVLLLQCTILSTPQQPEGNPGFIPKRFTRSDIHILVSFWLESHTETKWLNLHFLWTLCKRWGRDSPRRWHSLLKRILEALRFWRCQLPYHQPNPADLDTSCVLWDFTGLFASSHLCNKSWLLSDQLLVLTVLLGRREEVREACKLLAPLPSITWG